MKVLADFLSFSGRLKVFFFILALKIYFQHMQKLPGFNFGVVLFLVVLGNRVNCMFSTPLLACMCCSSPAIITQELINSSSTSFSLK